MAMLVNESNLSGLPWATIAVDPEQDPSYNPEQLWWSA